jgi:hypothetical protein
MNGQFVFYGWTGLEKKRVNCWNPGQKVGFYLWHHFSMKAGGIKGAENDNCSSSRLLAILMVTVKPVYALELYKDLVQEISQAEILLPPEHFRFSDRNGYCYSHSFVCSG